MGDGERVPGSGGGEHVWLKSVGVCPRRHWSCRASWELKSAICSKKNMSGFIPTCHRRVSAKPIATSIVKSRVYWSVQYWKGMGPVKGTAMRSAGRRHIWAVPNAELRRGKH
eukprot:1144389-Pelagomonas_calceolata.AAC.5